MTESDLPILSETVIATNEESNNATKVTDEASF